MSSTTIKGIDGSRIEKQTTSYRKCYWTTKEFIWYIYLHWKVYIWNLFSCLIYFRRLLSSNRLILNIYFGHLGALLTNYCTSLAETRISTMAFLVYTMLKLTFMYHCNLFVLLTDRFLPTKDSISQSGGSHLRGTQACSTEIFAKKGWLSIFEYIYIACWAELKEIVD